MITVSIITNVSSSFTPVLSLSMLTFLLMLLFYNTAVVIADVNSCVIIVAVVMVAVVVMAVEVKAVCFYVPLGGRGKGLLMRKKASPSVFHPNNSQGITGHT